MFAICSPSLIWHRNVQRGFRQQLFCWIKRVRSDEKALRDLKAVGVLGGCTEQSGAMTEAQQARQLLLEASAHAACRDGRGAANGRNQIIRNAVRE